MTRPTLGAQQLFRLRPSKTTALCAQCQKPDACSETGDWPGLKFCGYPCLRGFEYLSLARRVEEPTVLVIEPNRISHKPVLEPLHFATYMDTAPSNNKPEGDEWEHDEALIEAACHSQELTLNSKVYPWEYQPE